MPSLTDHPLSDRALLNLAADLAIAEGPLRADACDLGPATAALYDYCDARYAWTSLAVMQGVYYGWRDALRAVAAAIELIGPLAAALLTEEWNTQQQREAGEQAAAELVARWQANAREAGQ